MDRNFEQSILAYLDGALDARSEHELLMEISRDPAKQKLLRQYRRLDERLRDSSNPVAVPLRTQQALARRIPALKEILPDIPLAAVGGSAGGKGRFFTVPRGMLLSVLAGLIIGSLAIFRIAMNEPSAASLRTDAVRAESGKTEAGKTEAGKMGAGKSEAGKSEAGKTGAGKTGAGKTEAGNPVAGKTEAGNPVAGKTEAGNPVAGKTVAGKTVAGKTEAGRTGAGRTGAGRTGAGRVSATAPDVDETALPAFIPIVYEARRSALPSVPFDRSVPVADLSALFAGRLHFYIESGTSQFAGAGTADARESSFGSVYVAGLRYDFNHLFSAGIEAGQSRFARERLEHSRSAQAAGNGGEVIVIDRVLRDEALPWLRLHARYGFDVAPRLRFEADAGSGILLGHENSLVVSSGFSAVYALSTSLRARAGLHYSGTWLSPAAPQPLIIEPGSGVIGIIRKASAAEENFNSSIEFRIGFGVLLW